MLSTRLVSTLHSLVQSLNLLSQHLKSFKQRACISVLCSYACVFVNQVVHSDSVLTFFHDSPPAVRKYFTPFPISARPELCCYRNIDCSKVSNADFLHLTWHKKSNLNQIPSERLISLGSCIFELFVCLGGSVFVSELQTSKTFQLQQ